jgi:hypothetical protein
LEKPERQGEKENARRASAGPEAKAFFLDKKANLSYAETKKHDLTFLTFIKFILI